MSFGKSMHRDAQYVAPAERQRHAAAGTKALKASPCGCVLFGACVRAHDYLKREHQLTECLYREGPFEEYTRELAVGYRLAIA